MSSQHPQGNDSLQFLSHLESRDRSSLVFSSTRLVCTPTEQTHTYVILQRELAIRWSEAVRCPLQQPEQEYMAPHAGTAGLKVLLGGASQVDLGEAQAFLAGEGALGMSCSNGATSAGLLTAS